MIRQGQTRNWDVTQSVWFELWIDNGQVVELGENRVLPRALLEYVNDDPARLFELEVRFRSQGYYDPGSMYGGPDNLGSPPEGDDDRTMVHVHVDETDLNAAESSPQRRVIRELDPQLQAELFELFLNDVMEAELEGD